MYTQHINPECENIEIHKIKFNIVTTIIIILLSFFLKSKWQDYQEYKITKMDIVEAELQLSYGYYYESEILKITKEEDLNNIVKFLGNSKHDLYENISRTTTYKFELKLTLSNGSKVIVKSSISDFDNLVSTTIYFSRLNSYELGTSDMAFLCNLYNSYSEEYRRFGVPGVHKRID